MEVNLRSDGWYNRLQIFTFGKSKPDLYSLCPFFWLTIFCIIALPVTLIIKGIKLVFNKFMSYVDSMIDSYLDSLTPLEIGEMYNDGDIPRKPFFTPKKMRPWEMFERWRKRQLTNGKNSNEISDMIDSAYQAWLEDKRIKQEEWEAGEEARKEAKRLQIEAERKKEERAKKIRLMWIPIVTWTKRIFNLALTAWIMFILAWLINLIVMTFNPDIVLTGLIKIAKFIGVIALLVGLIVAFIYYIEWNKSNHRVPYLLRPFVLMGPGIMSILKGIGDGFKWIGNGIKGVFGLFWEYFKANKNDYCPAINWDVEEDNIDQ